MGDPVQDAYNSARFAAEISDRMQVPDRIVVGSGAASPAHSQHNGSANDEQAYNDLAMRRRDPRLDMQVPDRILVAGGNNHVASKSTPRELQLDAAVMPPTADVVRVSTPPRSIRLDEHAFPSATDDERSNNSTATFGADEDPLSPRRGHPRRRRHSSDTTADLSDAQLLRGGDSTSLALPDHEKKGSGSLVGSSGDPLVPHQQLSPREEIQLIRRQMAKLNHRLMAVELENQQQQHREMVLTVLVSAYFVGKLIMWLNRSL